ncbi:MAG: GNAT family N-acetyltransferase [Christensenellales bacterium]
MFQDASLHREDGTVQTVFGLDVLPAWRGRGVAGALMQAFTDAARQAGRRKVTLTCKAHLIGMYGHFGFTLIGRARSVHGGAEWFDMDFAAGWGKRSRFLSMQAVKIRTFFKI